jgi:hypothetical protein
LLPPRRVAPVQGGRQVINASIRAIIDLLKIKKDAQKTDLEIEKLKREKKSDQS